ncbi:aspartic-type endopeptidase [Drechmeria coniospora]|uniref:Aspartic-type endopeptidase n=1 Tax=Drechmeria coniospora TaxID=98403 RepID=A0A151GMP5_DRECN|nr:aspartic-type endopeptidase [Drechmeria coniospora]KYK58387.1 aspartic-type endopeptidase [Drechmeria coniospora]
MRPAAQLTRLVASASFVSAFYPFIPPWLQARSVDEVRRDVGGQDVAGFVFEIEQMPGSDSFTPAERAARDAARLANRYEGRHFVGPARDASFWKRASEYSIMKAVQPGQDLTVGIDQDGTDYSYLVKLELGSKAKGIYMLVDTGAGSSWIMGSNCKDDACSRHNTYGPADSDTFKSTTTDFTISYGSGTVSGQLASDTVSLAGVSFRYQFGLASQTSSSFSQFAFDGILGLAMNKGSNDNFFQSFSQAKKLDKNLFSVALNRAVDGGANTGELRFGAINPNKFTGDITYSPLALDDGNWVIKLDDMAYDGNKANVGGVLAYIDTGTSFLFGPVDLVKKLHSLVPGAESLDGMTYAVPCDSTKSMVLTFSGVDYVISPKDWINSRLNPGNCTSNIFGREVVKDSWLLGDTFLKNVYSVYDKDEKRIGFAKLAASNSSQTGTGAASSDESSASASTQSKSTATMSSPAAVTSSSTDASKSVGSQNSPAGSGSLNGASTTPSETLKSAAAGVGFQQDHKLAAVVFFTMAVSLMM